MVILGCALFETVDDKVSLAEAGACKQIGKLNEIISMSKGDTSKPGPWTLDWTVDRSRDDHYQSIIAIVDQWLLSK